ASLPRLGGSEVARAQTHAQGSPFHAAVGARRHPRDRRPLRRRPLCLWHRRQPSDARGLGALLGRAELHRQADADRGPVRAGRQVAALAYRAGAWPVLVFTRAPVARKTGSCSKTQPDTVPAERAYRAGIRWCAHTLPPRLAGRIPWGNEEAGRQLPPRAQYERLPATAL